MGSASASPWARARPSWSWRPSRARFSCAARVRRAPRESDMKAAQRFECLSGFRAPAVILGVSVALAIALGAASPAAAKSSHSRHWVDEGRGRRVSDQDFHWRGRLRAGQTLEIKNIIGDVKAEPTPGDEVEVTATKLSEHGVDPDQVRIEVT